MLAISSVQGNRQSLDGGAMFGNVPRAVWERWCRADDLGRIELACRAFLVELDGRRVLVETGIGAFFPPHLAERYGVVEPDHRLLVSLDECGVRPEDVDVVFLSHLHFDHAGGLLSAHREHGSAELVFPRAEFLVGRSAFARAETPHPRDRASFIPEMTELLRRSGRLHFIEDDQIHHPLLSDRVRLFHSDGHTPGMIVPTFVGSRSVATFCADLVPGAPWVHLPVTMGYDRCPELLIDEKRALYDKSGVGSWLLFTHDSATSAGRLDQDERGRFSLSHTQQALRRWDLDSDIPPSSG